MLRLYELPDCPSCVRIEDALGDLLFAHEVIPVENLSEVLSHLRETRIEGRSLPSVTKLPALVDKTDVYEGTDPILAHLKALERFEGEWYKFQSDVCYCDEDESMG